MSDKSHYKVLVIGSGPEVSARNIKQYRDGDKAAEKIIIEATD